MRLLGGTRLAGELERLQRQLDRIAAEPTDEEIWRSVELARHQERPYTLDYVERLLEDWFELHGDRARGRRRRGRRRARPLRRAERSCSSATRRAATSRSGRRRNFGMAYPGGLRARRCGRWSSPTATASRCVTLVDTPGAYPGVAAEQHGQGGAIARSQAAMARLGVPTVACVIGEGGSGGAVALALADRVLMQENAIYSVISPEGCAAILWRDAVGGPQGGGRVQARRRPLPRARRDRRDRARAGRRARTSTTTRRRACSASRFARRSTSSTGRSPATSCAAAGARSSARSASSRRRDAPVARQAPQADIHTLHRVFPVSRRFTCAV